MNTLFEKAKLAAFAAIPGSMNAENQYSKSISALLCLGVSADFDFDIEEFQQASIFIESDDVLTEHNMTLRAIEFFRGYADAIKDVMSAENLDFPAIQTEMIFEVRQCPSEYKSHLRSVIANLHSVSGPKEKAIFDRINL